MSHCDGTGSVVHSPARCPLVTMNCHWHCVVLVTARKILALGLVAVGGRRPQECDQQRPGGKARNRGSFPQDTIAPDTAQMPVRRARSHPAPRFRTRPASTSHERRCARVS